MKDDLLKKITDKTAKIGVLGLGYVGLPLAVEKAKAGYMHSCYDYSFIQKHSVFIFDTKNAMKAVTERSNIELL